MLSDSHKRLKFLAAAVWYIGSIILILKGTQLLLEADSMIPGLPWIWLAIVFGVMLGAVKARFIFTRSCRRNLARIDTLKEPRIWQFYSPGFFLALAIMITAGIILSRMAHGSYPFLIGVAVLDLAIAGALLISSHVYWARTTVSL